MNKLFLAICVVGVTVFSGCTAKLTDPDIDFKPPVYVEQMPAKEDSQDFTSKGSLFGRGDNPLFSDHKAMHINDIVTVEISEAAKSSSNSARQLNESDNSVLGGGMFTSSGDNSMVGNVVNKLNGLSNIGFNTKSSTAYAGKGSATKDATFTTTISARIVKVLQNGNYYIFGKREILVDDQKQIIQISGVIRPYDIDQYNKITSDKISEAKILYKTEGDVDRTTEQGWGTKIVESVWPF